MAIKKKGGKTKNDRYSIIDYFISRSLLSNQR